MYPMSEKFEDTKGVIRSPKSTEHYCQKKTLLDYTSSDWDPDYEYLRIN